MNVERRPGGAYEILPGGARGPLVWRNRGGRRELTAHGRATLGNFQDMLLWVPVFEQQFDTGLRAYDPRPRRTWYPLSPDTFEGLLEELQNSVPLAFANRLQDLPALPPAFKEWVLERLVGEDTLVVDESSDRAWTYDMTGTWHLSIQHTEMRGPPHAGHGPGPAHAASNACALRCARAALLASLCRGVRGRMRAALPGRGPARNPRILQGWSLCLRGAAGARQV